MDSLLSPANRETRPRRRRRIGRAAIASAVGRGPILLSLALLASPVRAGEARDRPPAASYEVHVHPGPPARVVVRAALPSDGQALNMAMSWPGDVPELADAGWPGLVRNLEVTDADGRTVPVRAIGPGGWALARPVTGTLTVRYEVDYEPLGARAWPASREAAFADTDHRIVVGRSLFLTTGVQDTSQVRFVLPEGWQAVLPWAGLDGGSPGATVASPEDLTENLVAFCRAAPDVLTAGGFHLKVVALGHWRPARAEVRRVLGTALRELVAMMGEGRAEYLVVLLPQSERGGESFRTSFAMNAEAAPTLASAPDWGHTIAHEVFHYWNGWRLVGADYASSQWFQEGFTEYAASLALISGGLIDGQRFREKLAVHVTRYRRLATALDNPGTRKGPPLYSGGALVAFLWDTMLRQATDGERGVPDLLRSLMRVTEGGARRYAWADIQAALEGVAPGEWSAFHRRHIHGTEPLPLAEALERVGLRLSEDGDGALRIEPDATAPESARRLLNRITGGPR